MTLKNIKGFLVSGVFPLMLFVLSPWWSTVLSDKKELTYSILAQRDITAKNVFSKEWPEIRVSYQDKDISSGSLLTISISNTGQIPVKREEFDSPIKIHLSDNSSIISQKVIGSTPENLSAYTRTVADGIAIEPLLLNPNDSLTIQILSATPIDVTDITARVSGLTKAITPTPQETSGIYLKYTPPIGLGNNTEKTILEIPITAVILATITFLCAAMLNLSRYRDKIPTAQKTVYFSFSAIFYGLSIFAMRITGEYASESNISKIAQATLIALCITIAFTLSDFLRSKLHPKNKT
ncbi:hypothetical protein IFU04_12220 [Pseudomonas syringae]|nr:hypothetical protein [Pseudomonas syringae]